MGGEERGPPVRPCGRGKAPGRLRVHGQGRGRRAQVAGGEAPRVRHSGELVRAHVDPDALYYFFHSPGKKGFGAAITGYTNPEYDKVVEQATGAESQPRRELLNQAQAMLARDVPLQVLWYPDAIWAYRGTAYGGWANDLGHGIFTKRSFLPGYEDIALKSTGSNSVAGKDEGTSAAPFVIGAVVLGLLVVLAIVLSRRRSTAEAE